MTSTHSPSTLCRCAAWSANRSDGARQQVRDRARSARNRRGRCLHHSPPRRLVATSIRAVEATRDAASATDYFRLAKWSNSAGTLKPQEEEVSTTASRISEINLVILAVADPGPLDRVLRRQARLREAHRRPFGGDYRWVEVYPRRAHHRASRWPPAPGGRRVEAARDGDQPDAQTTSTPPTRAAVSWRRRRRRGVADGRPVPPMFWFRDPDGHSLMVVQAPAA